MNLVIDQETYKTLRLDDFKQLHENNITPYPHKFTPNLNGLYQKITVLDFQNKYNDMKPGDYLEYDQVYMIVRIFSRRNASKKIIFMDGHEEGSKIQIVANLQKYIYKTNNLSSKEHFDLMLSVIRIGDIVGVAGIPYKTITNRGGELSLLIHQIELLSPCLKMLPPKTHENDKMVSGLQNMEIRYRQRYLDLIVNEDNLKTFKIRAKIIKMIRNYLDNDLGLTEVETPILNLTTGGAIAKSFETFSIDYHCPMYMRIAPELYLKMLIIGGFKGVYELGRQFRNESNDMTHNSEFTSLEYYMQNCDYNDLMTQCEQLLTNLVYAINGSLQIKYNERDIDFTPPLKDLILSKH